MADRTLVYVPLEELRDAERNPKRHNIEAIKASLRQFGVADVIGIIDGRTERLIGGHGRTEALRDLHIEGVPAPDGIRVKNDKWLVPIFRGWSSKDDVEANAMIIALNQHVIAGGFDRALLDDMMRELYTAQWDPLPILAQDDWPEFLTMPDDEGNPEPPRLGERRYQVVIDCEDEMQQRELLARFADEGLVATALLL